jgi:hypothetical protein
MRLKNNITGSLSLIPLVLAALIFNGCGGPTEGELSLVSMPYRLDTGLESRAVSFENPTGERGKSGMAASHLGVGRKGAPNKRIFPGQTVELCDIEGPGTIRHIWMAGMINEAGKGNERMALRSMVVRAYWEGQDHPSIECPLGDFMGLSQARVTSYQSAVHSVGENTALNIWLPMPFEKKARMTITNESDKYVDLWYQIDYTIKDRHPMEFGRLHVSFRRENPTTLTKDFMILEKREGKGRYMGAVIGIRTFDPKWWGEGEIKIYSDGDREFPTICGTGSEDYVCLSYGVQHTPFYLHGCSLNKDGLVSMYRWHLPDPIYWEKECYITIQQIGWGENGLYERQDDWSAAAFWYEPVPSEPLPAFPTLDERVANLSVQ